MEPRLQGGLFPPRKKINITPPPPKKPTPRIQQNLGVQILNDFLSDVFSRGQAARRPLRDKELPPHIQPESGARPTPVGGREKRNKQNKKKRRRKKENKLSNPAEKKNRKLFLKQQQKGSPAEAQHKARRATGKWGTGGQAAPGSGQSLCRPPALLTTRTRGWGSVATGAILTPGRKEADGRGTPRRQSQLPEAAGGGRERVERKSAASALSLRPRLLTAARRTIAPPGREAKEPPQRSPRPPRAPAGRRCETQAGKQRRQLPGSGRRERPDRRRLCHPHNDRLLLRCRACSALLSSPPFASRRLASPCRPPSGPAAAERSRTPPAGAGRGGARRLTEARPPSRHRPAA